MSEQTHIPQLTLDPEGSAAAAAAPAPAAGASAPAASLWMQGIFSGQRRSELSQLTQGVLPHRLPQCHKIVGKGHLVVSIGFVQRVLQRNPSGQV